MKLRRAANIVFKLARVTLVRLPDGEQKREAEIALEYLEEWASLFSMTPRKEQK